MSIIFVSNKENFERGDVTIGAADDGSQRGKCFIRKYSYTFFILQTSKTRRMLYLFLPENNPFKIKRLFTETLQSLLSIVFRASSWII